MLIRKTILFHARKIHEWLKKNLIIQNETLVHIMFKCSWAISAEYAAIVNGICYRQMTTEFICPNLNKINLNGIWIQQKFKGRVIARNDYAN